MAIPLHDSHAIAASNETEQRLLESALTVFSRKGYEGATIREIIECAEVTRPVLYYYFQSKEHLFCRLMELWFDRVALEMDEALSGVTGCRERLVTLMRHAFEGAQSAPDVLRFILQVFMSPLDGIQLDKEKLWRSRFDRVVRVMEDGLSSGEIAGASAETLAMAFCGTIDYYIMAYAVGGIMLPRNEAELVDLFLTGAVPRDAHGLGCSENREKSCREVRR